MKWHILMLSLLHAENNVHRGAEGFHGKSNDPMAGIGHFRVGRLEMHKCLN
jgi:hypothetical protein